MTPAAPALACAPGALSPADREGHFQLVRELFAGSDGIRIGKNAGYEFRFPDESFADVAAFVENERKCCPFLTFSLHVKPAGAGIVLRVTGPEGAASLLERELLGVGDTV